MTLPYRKKLIEVALPLKAINGSTPVAPSVPAGWPYGAMPVLCLLSLISRNSPKKLGIMSSGTPSLWTGK